MGLWPFFLDRTVTLHKRMHGTVSQVADLTQDVDAWSRLQPLVTKVEQEPDNPHRYKITEHLSGPWNLWEYDNPFHVVFTSQEDERGRGVNASVTLSQRMVFPKLESQMRVKDTEVPGIVEVTEVIEMNAFSLLIPYILKRLTSAHEAMLERLAEKIEGSNGNRVVE